MEQFKYLKLPRLTPASNQKGHVSSAVPKLSNLDRLVLITILIGFTTMLYGLLTMDRPIEAEKYRDNISIELENIA
jgi:hypothetical protein